VPVSKRLRFEILRRDNHACRYCGGSAPDVVLTVDHVIPVALGGNDEPANLVAACKDCNGGKSSVPADASIVDDVAADALRWARAMDIVAQGRDVERLEAKMRYRAFMCRWERWTNSYDGSYVDIPDNFTASIDQFLRAGLELDDLLELVDVAMSARTRETWRYFCGCCWRRIKQSHEHARSIIELWDAEDGNA
jgi:hypothetical protein